MFKPRVFAYRIKCIFPKGETRLIWECEGLGIAEYGDTPVEAYEMWLAELGDPIYPIIGEDL